MIIRRLLSLLVLSFTTLSSVAAVEDFAQARLVIEKSSAQIEQTLKQPAYQNDFSMSAQFVDGIVSEIVDMHRVSLLVLGKNIRKTTPEQRQRFKDEFKTLLVRTYTRAFLQYKDWSISFSPYKDDKNDGKTIVKTEVQQQGKRPVKISYRMLLNKSGQWKVYEITIEGISLVINYRSSFSQQIAQTGSIDSVIQTLVDKNSKAKIN